VSIVRKKWLIVSVVLACIGIPLIYYGNASREVTTLLDHAQSDVNKTSFTFDYSKGQKLLVGVGVGKDWFLYADVSDEFKEGGAYVSLVAVNVTVIDPNGHPTKLEAEYRVVSGTEDLALYIVKVYQKSDGLTLKTFNQSWVAGNSNYTSEYLFENEMGGIANMDGTYNATVSLVGPPIPPTTITLYKYSVTTVSDYWYLLPLGAAMLVVGGLIAVLAGLTTPRKSHAKPVE
jgi:hypothetical protein